LSRRSISTWFRWAHTNRHLVYFRDREGDENYRAFSADIESETITPLTPEGGAKSYLQEVSHKFPQEMLIKHNQRDKRYFDLFRINVVTGESKLVFENPDFYDFFTDTDLQLRFAARLNAQGAAEWFERQTDGTWQPFIQIPIGDVDSTHLVDMSVDGKTLYLIDSRGRDTAALFAMDMATRKTALLAADEEFDISQAALDEESRHPIAARATRDRVRWYPVEASAKQDLANLARHGSGDLVFVSDSLDRRLASIYYQRDSESSEFALLDRSSRQVRKLFVDRKSLAGLPLRKLQPVIIPSRDGLRLNGYLTMPEGGDGRVPLVLLIHGGPYLRDTWGFSPTHQWLANRGYAVLAVNYRGSTGFGKAFIAKADKEWGGRMHDDLIDAVDWAIGQGIADAGRVGFFGGSYGGYSALTAATRTPEVFACIVDLFGIQSQHLHEDHPALLGTVDERVEESARRSRHRRRTRVPHRAFAAHPYRSRGAADPDRARHERRAGGAGRIRADGDGAEGARRARHLHHVLRRRARLRAGGKPARLQCGRGGVSGETSRRTRPADRR
jgi:dipeptidyl aminopeptidase/acylaminoacyl peptidase